MWKYYRNCIFFVDIIVWSPGVFCVVVVVVGQCDIVERSLSLEVHSVSARCILKYVQLAQCVDIVFCAARTDGALRCKNARTDDRYHFDL